MIIINFAAKIHMTSLTEENYLKAIYTLIDSADKKASTNEIAKKMETKASSVTDMLKRLNDKDLVDYKKYKTVRITEKGKQVAISIIRKHRLWEYFLVKSLNFGWDEVHDIAEQLEHIESAELTDKLDEFLDFPKFDPHGDPIPNSKGIFPNRESQKLSEVKVGTNLIITGVEDHSPSFLNFLNEMEIELGTELSLKTKHPFDNSIIVVNPQNQKFTLSQKVASNLYIKIKNEN
ncbi:metal-dependent transcriptional regulator [Vicingaceae bacterium]|nr:metal-dependent transcriptional regulator [Vicingaceae bacterium]